MTFKKRVKKELAAQQYLWRMKLLSWTWKLHCSTKLRF